MKEKERIKKELKLNQYLQLKLIDDKTTIFVDGKSFRQCKYLLFNIPERDIRKYDYINSIDEMENDYSKINEVKEGFRFDISPEQEFLAHSSNLQVWVEYDYDTRLLHRNLAFPLLKELARCGDPLAKKRFKEEITKRIKDGNDSVLSYLLANDYLRYFSTEELRVVIQYLNQEKYPLFKVIKDMDLDLKSIRLKDRAIQVPSDHINHNLTIYQQFSLMPKEKQSKFASRTSLFSHFSKRSILRNLNEMPYVNIPKYNKDNFFYDLTNLIRFIHYDSLYDNPFRFFISETFLELISSFKEENIDDICLAVELRKIRYFRVEKRRLEASLIFIIKQDSKDSKESEYLIYDFSLFGLRKRYFREIRRSWLNRYIREHNTIYEELWEEYYFHRAEHLYSKMLQRIDDEFRIVNVWWKGDKRLKLHFELDFPSILDMTKNASVSKCLVESQLLGRVMDALKPIQDLARQEGGYLRGSCQIISDDDQSYFRSKFYFRFNLSQYHFKTRLLTLGLTKFGKVVKLLLGREFFNYYNDS